MYYSYKCLFGFCILTIFLPPTATVSKKNSISTFIENYFVIEFHKHVIFSISLVVICFASSRQ